MTGPIINMLLENKSYVEAINVYQKNNDVNWLQATTWLQKVAGQIAVEQVNQNLADKRSEKLRERVEQLLNAYGIANLLQSLIFRINQLEEKDNNEFPHLRLLLIDLERTLKNYKNINSDFGMDED